MNMLTYLATRRSLCTWPSALGALLVVGAVGCSSNPPPLAITRAPEAGTDSGGSGVTYKMVEIGTGGCATGGKQAVAAVSGSTIAFASLAETTMQQECNFTINGMPAMSKVDVWNVCYAESTGGGAFTTQVVTSQPYEEATGVGLTFDPSGAANIAYSGLGATPPAETCGANDAFVTTMASGGSTFSPGVQISNGSMSNGLVAGMKGNCSQNVCGEGDVTGLWPTIGINSGTTMVAYRDTHFGFSHSDMAQSDVELAEGTGSSYQVLTVDVSRGGGQYNKIAFTPAGLAAIVEYDETGQSPGLYIDLQLLPGSFGTQEGTGGWTSQQLETDGIGEVIGFAISPKGVFGLAYYDTTRSLLLYTHSTDGMSWSTPEAVDRNGTTGQYPSLAFDENDNPAIAYYRCNAHLEATSCDPATDGLLLARQSGSGSTWTISVISAISAITDGPYPALAFLNGKAYIAFQQQSYNAVTATTTSSWWVAEEP
jgi:hypothetical protein